MPRFGRSSADSIGNKTGVVSARKIAAARVRRGINQGTLSNVRALAGVNTATAAAALGVFRLQHCLEAGGNSDGIIRAQEMQPPPIVSALSKAR